jgi:hypothetical protein
MIVALQHAIAKVRYLPEDKQALAAELLEDLVREKDVYILSPDERIILEEAMARVDRGEFASDAKVQALWQKCGL